MRAWGARAPTCVWPRRDRSYIDSTAWARCLEGRRRGGEFEGAETERDTRAHVFISSGPATSEAWRGVLSCVGAAEQYPTCAAGPAPWVRLLRAPTKWRLENRPFDRAKCLDGALIVRPSSSSTAKS